MKTRQFQLFALPGLMIQLLILIAFLFKQSVSRTSKGLIVSLFLLLLNLLNIFLLERMRKEGVDFIPLMMPLRVIIVSGVAFYLMLICR